MTSKRSYLIHWIETGAIAEDHIDDAVAMADVTPDQHSWSRFIDHLLLWTGALTLISSVIFFLAYNWDAMGRFAKFALVEGLIIVSLIGYWRLGAERITGKAALMSAALLLGALLALYGQVYQTGADSWQLFANWALLILPWVIIGRLAALWLLWLTLINLALFLYFSVFRGVWGVLFSQEDQLLLAFTLNTGTLVLWEVAATRLVWLKERWAVRLIAIASGAAVTTLMLLTIFDWHDHSGWVSVVYPLWAIGMFYAYRYRQPDLFMLSGSCLSLIIAATALLARLLLDGGDAGGFLFVAMAVIGMSALAAVWLKRVNEKFES